MKTASPPKPRDNAAKRSFAWGVRSSDIAWAQAKEHENAMDGSNCGDCSFVTPFDKPRKQKPVRPSES